MRIIHGELHFKISTHYFPYSIWKVGFIYGGCASLMVVGMWGFSKTMMTSLWLLPYLTLIIISLLFSLNESKLDYDYFLFSVMSVVSYFLSYSGSSFFFFFLILVGLGFL